MFSEPLNSPDERDSGILARYKLACGQQQLVRRAHPLWQTKTTYSLSSTEIRPNLVHCAKKNAQAVRFFGSHVSGRLLIIMVFLYNATPEF